MTEGTTFQPNWASAPGETISDILKEKNLTVIEFAGRIGSTPEHAKELIDGRVTITIDTARKLELVLGGSAAFWMLRESQYREDLARLQSQKSSASDATWLSEIPLKDMIKFNWLRHPLQANAVPACLSFFDVPNVKAWRETYRSILETAAFRTSPSFGSKPGAVAAWLRQAEIESMSIECKRWNAKRFRETLSKLRTLTWTKNPSSFLPDLVKQCSECGVAVVVVRAPNGCRASGATRFLSTNKALLVLSFRYLSDDHFWFTFFHEAGHLLLHGQTALFLEGPNTPSDRQEDEANQFAARVLIPSQFQAALLKLRINGREVIKFARHVGVSPGVVVGQLQHLGRIKPNQLNSLKRRFAWS